MQLLIKRRLKIVLKITLLKVNVFVALVVVEGFIYLMGPHNIVLRPVLTVLGSCFVEFSMVSFE